MGKPWITKIAGNQVIKIGKPANYVVTGYKTTQGVDLEDVNWTAFVYENGWRELRGPKKPKGSRTSFTFTNVELVGKKILIEAYGSRAERKDPPGIETTLQMGPPAINNIKLLDITGKPFKETPKYGQTILAQIETTNMIGMTLKVVLWERDTIADTGHDPKSNQELFSANVPVLKKDGIAKINIPLTPVMAKIAGNNFLEGSTHEYYMTVHSPHTRDKISTQTLDVLDEVIEVKKKPVENKSKIDVISPHIEANNPIPKAAKKVVKVLGIGTDPKPGSSKSAQIVEGDENLIEAYFAKKDFGETDEPAGSTTFTFEFDNGSDDEEINFNTIAPIIKSKQDPKLVSKKEYVKLESIIRVLEDNRDPKMGGKKKYLKGETIEIPTHKLGEVYKKVNSASLGEEVYLLAKTAALDGKPVAIQIQEKENIISSPMPALEIKSDDDEGTQKTSFKATAEKGTAKVRIKLRPKSDEEFEQWQEKIKKGKEVGTYNYKFINGYQITNGNISSIASAVKKNARKGTPKNPKLKDNESVFVDDIKKALGENSLKRKDHVVTIKSDETITFPKYEKTTEFLWLKANCTGDKKQHNEEFLNEDGSYFKIGGNDGCLIDKDFFFNNYDNQFENENLSDGNKSSLERIFISINEYYSNEKRCCNKFQLAYFLATIKHETNHTFNPINELGGNSYYERMYDPVLGKNANRRAMAIANGNTEQGDGVKYHGRGYVQLTWKNNYIKMKEKFSVDLVNFPDKALDHDLAMKILIYGSEAGTFTGVKISNYIDENKKDYINARKVINGLDKASTIAGYAEKLELCIKVVCNCEGGNDNVNEFGLVQLTKIGNNNIVNYGLEDFYIYEKEDGSLSEWGQHGDDWILPEKASAFSEAVDKLVQEYPNQKIHVNDCSAYNPNHNLGHAENGAHSFGGGFDCKFLTKDGTGSNDILSLDEEDININKRFVELLIQSGQFSKFFSHNGIIPGSLHAADHLDHLHGQ